MKKILFIGLMLSLLAFATSDAVFERTSVIVTSESSLEVSGKTNINRFTCDFDVNKLKNPIEVIYYLKHNKMVFNKTVLVLENECFDCGGKALNNDLQKILKTNQYPQITLFLNEISELEAHSDNILANIDITIAGINKNYKVPLTFKKDKGMLITGDLTLSMQDYNLEAPKKLFGLVTVQDEITIDFQLAVREN
ncbi:YceI family protein [Aestuariivivens sediminis]|uniref:YceI family protein n=1 Tax=Aestuariivivens sediminis TaxID=2913557 RepID=UPI001F5AC5E3